MAEISRKTLQVSGRFPRSIAAKILPATAFYPAEECH
jgi:peptide methionine sulfoxide reductase msrA/msrB